MIGWVSFMRLEYRAGRLATFAEACNLLVADGLF